MNLGGRRSKILLALLAVVALLVVFVSLFDWREVLDVLARAEPATFALGIVAFLLSIASWAEVQRRLLRSSGTRISPGRCGVIYAAGLFPKLALPVGYASSILVLAHLFQRESSLPYERSLAVVSVSEALNFGVSTALGLGSAISLFLLGGLLPPPFRLWAGLGLGTAVVATPAVLAWYRRDAFERLVEVVERAVDRIGAWSAARVGISIPVERIETAIDRYATTFAEVSRYRATIGVAIALTFVGWTFSMAALYASGLAIGVRLPLDLALFVVSAAGYANVLPIPGGIGGYEALGAGLIFAFAAVDPPTAVAVVLLFRVCSYWFPLGLSGIATVHLSIAAWRDVPETRGEP